MDGLWEQATTTSRSRKDVTVTAVPVSQHTHTSKQGEKEKGLPNLGDNNNKQYSKRKWTKQSATVRQTTTGNLRRTKKEIMAGGATGARTHKRSTQ